MIRINALFHILSIVSIVATGTVQASEVSVGEGYVLATINGSAWSWGSNHRGQLGNGRAEPPGYWCGRECIPEPAVQVFGFENGVESISTGFGHSRAVKDGAVWWWGFSQCSANDPACDKWAPTPIEGLQSGVSMVSGNMGRACAIKDGGVWCWGRACDGRNIGHVCPANLCLRPMPLIGLEQGVSSVSVGKGVGCAIKDSGLWCWTESSGIFGYLNYTATPVSIPELADSVTSVSIADKHICAVKNGEVWCWGDNSGKQLGSEGPLAKTPRKVTGLPGNASSIAAGGSQSCAVMENGEPWCWGSLNPVPIQIQGLPSRVVQISVSSSGGSRTNVPNACAVLDQGEIWCWGRLLSSPGVWPQVLSQPEKIEGLPTLVVPTPQAPTTGLEEAAIIAPQNGLAEANNVQALEAIINGQQEEIATYRTMIRELLNQLSRPLPEGF